MSVVASIASRWKTHQLHHFVHTKWGRNLKKLQGVHAGKRCFIIGNGPSLCAKDLEQLKDEYTFAFNRIYHIFSETSWRPTYYCTQDSKIAVASAEEISKKIQTPYIFAPINLRWYENADLNSAYFFNPKLAGEEVPEFSEDISSFVGVGNTVAYTAMQIAAYMGFSEIYLLGVDHSFRAYQDESGNIVTDQKAKDYFTDKYNQDKEQLFVPRLDLSTMSYMVAQQYTKNHPVKIYNATRGGKLEVFPRVNFDDLFTGDTEQK